MADRLGRHGVWTLAELDGKDFPGVPLAVLGDPVGHSISPQMHNGPLAAMAEGWPEAREWRYHKLEVPPEALPDALNRLFEKRFRGLNLTIPHKVLALEHVVGIDPVARRMGAVNTLKRLSSGYFGYNTDGYGFERAVREELGIGLKNEVVILLGAGGAARAIAVQCLESGCAELWVGNRSAQRLSTLLEILAHTSLDKARIHGFELAKPPHDLPNRGLVVNATPLGLRPDDPPPIDISRFDYATRIFDTTYGAHESSLIRSAALRKMRSARGLSMLVWQGARALEIWTERAVPAEVMKREAEVALQ